jgi:hypothetical protein
METKHRVKWQVGLSNGETFYEDKGIFIEVKDELSPWNKLLEYISHKNLTITSLSLYTDSGQHFNLPSKGKNPKFREFDRLEKPTGFRVFRKIGQEMVYGEKKMVMSDWFTVAEAQYEKCKLQIWVDEQNPKNCYTLWQTM